VLVFAWRGVQDPEYRHAQSDTLVEADSVAMSGPSGAPHDELSPDERRERDRDS
jgi:hypothetical protein